MDEDVEGKVPDMPALGPEAGLDELAGLSSRARNALANFGVESIGELVRCRARHLRKIPNLGSKSIAEIEAAMRSAGLGPPGSDGADTPLSPGSSLDKLPGVSARAVNAMERSGIVKIEDFTALTRRALRAIPGLGIQSIEEVDAALGEVGLAEPVVGLDEDAALAPDSSIDRLPGLSTRSLNALNGIGVRNIEDFKALTRTALKKLPNLGSKSIEEIETALRVSGIARPHLAVDVEAPLELGSNLERLSGISTRSINALNDFGINTVEDLQKLSRQELLRIPNLGEKSIGELEIDLKCAGFKLGWFEGDWGIPLGLSSNIERLPGLATRAVNALNDSGVRKVEDLIKLSRRELLRIPNLGAKSIGEIEIDLKGAGFKPGWLEGDLGAPLDLDSNVEKLPGLATRAINALNDFGFCKINDLMNLTERDLLKIPYIGRSALYKIDSALELSGMTREEKIQCLAARFDDGPLALSSSIKRLSGLSARSIVALEDDGFHQIESLISLKRRELLRIPYIGWGSVIKIDKALAEAGFSRHETMGDVVPQVSKGEAKSALEKIEKEKIKNSPRPKMR